MVVAAFGNVEITETEANNKWQVYSYLREKVRCQKDWSKGINKEYSHQVKIYTVDYVVGTQVRRK